MMKTSIGIVICAILCVVLLAGCSSTPSPSPTPSETATPTATQTPTTTTPIPTATVTVTATPEPEPTPTPTPTPEPTPTVVAPGSFNLVGPATATVLSSSLPVFSWETANGATSYLVEVATTPLFGDATFIEKTVQPRDAAEQSYTPTEPFTGGTVYYWRVTAVNSVGSVGAFNAPLWFSRPLEISSTGSAGGLVITPDGTRALVPCNEDGTLYIVSLTDTPEVVKSISLEAGIGQITVSSDGRRAVVAGNGKYFVVDLVNESLVNIISTASTTPCEIAFTKGAAKLLVPGGVAPGSDLDFIDLSSYSITQFDIRSQSLGVPLVDIGTPVGIAVTPDGVRAIMTASNGNVYTIEIATRTLLGVATGLPPGGSTVAITPDGKNALVAGNGMLYRINLAANQVIATISDASAQLPARRQIAISPDGLIAISTDYSTLYVTSLVNNTLLRKYTLSCSPVSVCITPDGSTVILSTLEGTLVFLPVVELVP